MWMKVSQCIRHVDGWPLGGHLSICAALSPTLFLSAPPLLTAFLVHSLDAPLSVQTENAMATTAHAAVDCDPLLFRLPDFPSVIPIKPSPAMSPSDAEGMTGWVTINGERLPAMVVGGEPRIPIALLHNRPLNEHAYSEIERMMEDLNIHKSLATPCQMNSLRQMDPDVDAERICGIIRNESTLVSKCDIDVDEAERLSVEHHMFGRVCGWVYPSRKGGRCARCQTCHKWFTPQDFVAHSHKENKENQRTVHWGFDPVNNWQLMVQLVQPSAELPEHQARWKEFLDNSPLKNSKAVKRTADDVQVC
uniref:C-SKI_SMAD_bind domain-containing protein n=1 Tax=Heterorhabditis bacteriophora TaxID=37862 RepID=A0A1I7XBW6_HETBA